jgi:hypothetical protein
MKKNAIYWKARLDAIMRLIKEEKGGDRTLKNNNSVLLRNGIIPKDMRSRFQKVFNKYNKEWIKTGNTQQLSFSEITRFNTWFEMYPEKVAGNEIVTTSREFPVSIKGTKQDILNTINKTLNSGQSRQQRIRIARVKAQAKLKLLQLIKL